MTDLASHMPALLRYYLVWKRRAVPYVILSYPRSGNHWVRYVVEWFSGLPTLGANEGEHLRDPYNRYDRPICARAHLPHVDWRAHPIAKKRHAIADWDDRGAGLICIVRDYAHSISRHLALMDYGDDADGARAAQICRYLAILDEFDRWPSRKILIYYEDLLERPGAEIRRLLEFVGYYDEEKLTLFLQEEYGAHKERALQTLPAGSASHGTDKRVTESFDEVRGRWDSTVKNQAPDLWFKYLRRYGSPAAEA